MLALLSCALLAGIAAAPALDAGERQPLPVVVVVPAGDLGHELSRSEIVGALDDALRAKTSLRAEAFDAEAIAQRCPQGTFRCFLDQLVKGEGLLAIISVAVGEDRSRARFAAMLIDARDGAACKAADPDARDEAIEDCIARTAIAAKANAQNLPTSEVTNEARGFVTGAARDALHARGLWEPYGRVEVTFPRAGFEVELDGRTIGATEQGLTIIEHVLPGTRKLRIKSAAFESNTIALAITLGQTEHAAFEWTPASASYNRVLLIGGITAAVAGGAIGIYAATRSQERLTLCPQDCSSRFLGTSGGSAPEGIASDARSGGLLFAPFALGLIGAGATWVVGALLADPEQTPWIELVAGAVVLGATYSIGAAVGGGSP